MPDTDDRNWWLEEKCAAAFWDQKLALPYQELLRDTAELLEVRPGERWLDLGCGGGQLTALLWGKSQGRVGEIVAADCNPANARVIAALAARLRAGDRVRFETVNFSDGLGRFADASFDGILSGLAISYAESRDPATGRYTDAAYNRLLAEMYRVLKPGGRILVSVNVPEPVFSRVFWRSLRRGLRISKPLRALTNTIRMWWVARWLCREARRGRFHYLPADEIGRRLTAVGFSGFQSRLAYADQAFLFSATKQAQTEERAA